MHFQTFGIMQQTITPPPPARSMDVKYGATSMSMSYWDSTTRRCCSPASGVYTLYMDVIVTGTPAAWKTEISPDYGYWYRSNTTGSGSLNNFYVYLNANVDDNMRLYFRWSDTNDIAYTIWFYAYAGAC